MSETNNVDIMDVKKQGGFKPCKSKKSKIITGIMLVLLLAAIGFVVYCKVNNITDMSQF